MIHYKGVVIKAPENSKHKFVFITELENGDHAIIPIVQQDDDYDEKIDEMSFMVTCVSFYDGSENIEFGKTLELDGVFMCFEAFGFGVLNKDNFENSFFEFDKPFEFNTVYDFIKKYGVEMKFFESINDYYNVEPYKSRYENYIKKSFKEIVKGK